MTPFCTSFKVKFRDADPAQIMYFGNLANFAHDAFEEFIVHAGYKYREWFSKNDLMIPIRHLEVDYRAPFVPGELYQIDVSVAEIRTTSFKMKYQFHQNGKVHGVVHMVHAVLDSKTQNKKELPIEMKNRLSPFLESL